ncbi:MULTISPECIES: BCCT family transporter [Leisingera]|jgi:choline-glycine betaine transporter|uniref:BCCT family transporter n=1 Tax=Leisingera aquaemixtae TaxID=1396826 RepID=A0A0P1HNR9_9RHOB|nr:MULTISPECIES: BCCT family transporter [Leisingera]QDI76594.1 BCCT family transporter [Leisingera aquaemixtae]UWQ25733.1 BCCT family transporter [Leisingera aquaemixtae]UWQ42351.1 BCCT family transporter [Leisingera aquaemixtae]UWQ46644.1 BCCT family transporter [Leisingera aquaemixtae]CUH99967.1 Glycine betaine transporter OpuD [Leisingera aquaemixtae]
MSIKQPFTDLEIKTSNGGFYEGHSVEIALLSKGIMVALVLWALVWPANATGVLGSLNWRILEDFNAFYIIIVGFFAFFLFVVAALPQTGKRIMGAPGEPKEFSDFSWFSMMFGAGLGVGLMVFATAEPLGLWGSNPVVLSQEVAANSEEAIQSGFRYTFLHYGFHAWAIYVVTGLSLAYYAYTRGMPLTIRTALTPLFGKLMNGFLGHVVDVLGVVATILGVSVTIGFGVSQFVDGLYAITGMEWMMDMSGDAPAPGTVGLLAGLFAIMGLSIISAVSGVGRGVKYLSNLNLVLSIILLLVFVVFGSFVFAMSTYASAIVDYILNFTALSFGAFGPQSAAEFSAALPAEAAPYADALRGGATNAWGSFEGFKSGLEGEAAALSDDVLSAAYAAGEPQRQFGWQAGWTTFYWAWWIAFSPFVGLFLARISRGRSVREFIVGCVLAPALVCFAWMTILGGTAIDLELNGAAEGAIIGASNTAKLFVTLQSMIDGGLLSGITIMCVVLIMTFLVTSADSGILVMNTIMSGGDQNIGNKHKIVWGLILTAVIGTLLFAGKQNGGADPMEALKSAMIIGALPFTMVMGLMCISLAKALFRDGQREKAAERAPAE